MSLIEELILDEDIKLKMYKCPAGKWTIGVGHNIEDNGISEAAAMFIFKEDIEQARKHSQRYSFFSSLNEVRQEVLINMMFNMGPGKISGFKKMLAALEEEDYEEEDCCLGDQ